MAPRRIPLSVPRAVHRIRTDAWDDIWPDALSLVWLPRTPAEQDGARRRIAAFRADPNRIPQGREALVPKPNGLMRPAHQLAHDSRVYYQALVDSFMYDVDTRLVGKNHVFGYRPLAPRSSKAPFGFGLRQWKRFRDQLRREITSGSYGAFVRTDLAAFFERIPHGPLEERLTSLGVRPDIAKELRVFLRRTMGKARGLPQGPDPSGFLSTAYLHPLDQSLISAGYGFVRYVDDIVLFASNRTEAKKALRLLETEARELDLLIQSAKTQIVVGASAMKAAVSEDDEIAGVAYVVAKRGVKKATRTIRKLWRDVSSAPTVDSRSVKYSLGRLTDNRDAIAVDWCLARLGELDYLAPQISRYLALFAGRPRIQDAIAQHLASPANLSEWEEMFLFRSLLSAKRLSRPLLGRARTVLDNKNAGIEVRQFGAILLGKHGDAADHGFVATRTLDNLPMAHSGLLALQLADARLRGRYQADVQSKYPEARSLMAKLNSARPVRWPEFT